MRWVVLAGLGLLAVVAVLGAVYAWWLGGGLLNVYTTAQNKADVAQKQLEKVQESVEAGDVVKAKKHLRVAQVAVDDAQAAARAPQVRVAKWLPFTRGTVSDLDHLLTAAEVVIDSADGGLDLYTQFKGGDSKLFQDGQIDLDSLEQGASVFADMREALSRARSELLAVDGSGPLGDEAMDKRRTGLKQIRELRTKIAPYAPVVEAMPAALGADGTRRYLVAIMNPAEMRGSGGAPLSIAMVVVKDGKISVPMKGTASSLYVNSPDGLLGDSPEVVWKRVKGDPFQPEPGEPQRFVNTNFNPDFRVSGEQMMRATPTFFGKRTDGVIAIDVIALAKLLDVIGPVQSDYGELNSANLVDELLVKSYEEQGTDVVGRQERNNALMSTMLDSLMAGGGLMGKVEAVLSVAPQRHVQMYFRDDRLQRIVERRDLAGAVPTPRTGNLTAVYTQNGNGSKVDVFQKRTIDETVTLNDDGSATVRRSVTLDNQVPPYTGLGPDIRRGYTTRWATNLVINLLPPGAKVTRQPDVELAATVNKGVDQAGRTFANAAVVTPPDESAQLTWEYKVPRAAVPRDGGLRFVDHVVTQNTVNGFLLRTTVIAPDGWTLQRVDDVQPWYVDGSQAFLQVNVDTPTKLRLQATPT
jgi:hypothetical protein